MWPKCIHGLVHDSSRQNGRWTGREVISGCVHHLPVKTSAAKDTVMTIASRLDRS